MYCACLHILVLVFKLVLLLTYVCVLYIRVCCIYVCVLVRAIMHASVCSHTHTYTHINAHTCTQTGTHTQKHAHTCTRTQSRTRAFPSCFFIHLSCGKRCAPSLPRVPTPSLPPCSCSTKWRPTLLWSPSSSNSTSLLYPPCASPLNRCGPVVNYEGGGGGPDLFISKGESNLCYQLILTCFPIPFLHIPISVLVLL